MVFKVKLKWNGKTFKDVEVDPGAGPAGLKKSFHQLTGVPLERQKIMANKLWKGTLKDDQDLTGLAWKDGLLIAMMGSSEGIPPPPVQETVFIEDMSTKEKQKVAAVDPPGLVNLGNTCYMNATVQCLRAVPELRSSLSASPLSSGSGDVGEKMVSALDKLYNEMDSNDNMVTPTEFVTYMRMRFPQFAQRSDKGVFAQQDADEFFNELMQVMSTKLTQPGGTNSFGGSGNNAVRALFGIEYTTEMKCIESEDEPVSRGSDSGLRLQCTVTKETLSLTQGIKLSLEDELEKGAETLGRNALFKKTQRIRKLPKYLAVQENRFYWKRTPESRDHQGVNCKMLREVKFSPEMDVYDFCDRSLQKILDPPRNAYLKAKMDKTKKKSSDDGDAKEATSSSSADAQQDVDMADPELQAALQMSMEVDQGGPPGELGPGIPDNFRGMYELFALVTHKGRASDSGHYIGWVKVNDKDDWVCFDDETAAPCKESDIMLLSGGGDRDIAYLLFYRAKE